MKGVLSVQVTVASLVVSAFTGSANNVKGCGELHTQLPIAKESQCQRILFTGTALSEAVTQKEAAWERPSDRRERSLLSSAAAGSVQPGRFIGRASDRRERNKNQIGKPYLIPLRFLSLPRLLPPYPPSSCFSFPLSLLLNCFHGREETDMDTALISDTGKHFYLFLPLPPLVFQSLCPYTWFLDAPCWCF